MTLKLPHQKRARWLLLMSQVILAMAIVIPTVILAATHASLGVIIEFFVAAEMIASVLFFGLVHVLLGRDRRGPRVGPGPPSHPLPVTGPIETSRGSRTPKEELWTQSGRS